MSENKYPMLLSPVKIGNVVLKNRMISSPSMPHFLQGPEGHPQRALIDCFAMRAKSGVGVVTVGHIVPTNRSGIALRFPNFDIEKPENQNYFSNMTQAIHFYGAKASFALHPPFDPKYDASVGDFEPEFPAGTGFDTAERGEIPRERLLEMVEETAQQALCAKICGFDMAFVHAAHRLNLVPRLLSPITNKRTDEFGGPMENRARFLLMICKRIKELCGPDFLIECSVSGVESAGGNTAEDIIELTRLAEGLVDIFQVRNEGHDPLHPTGYEHKRTPFVEIAAAIRASNPPMLISTVSGFHDPESAEAAIEAGKTDLVASARPWIADPDFGKKIYEGRSEDIVPCIRCNKCLVAFPKGPYNSVCSVNPTWGTIADKIDTYVSEPEGKKKVAVIGGGPAGMEAALIASQRGHDVTLFEKTDALGGQLKHAAFTSFKWPLRDFNNYMIRQVEKAKIEVRLNTAVTPDMLEDKGYDHVLVAIGGKPVLPKIPGADSKNVVFGAEIFGHEKELAEDIVVIGGGEIGVDAGLYLAENGHKVFVIEALPMLCAEATPIHYRSMVEDYWLKCENFEFAVNAKCTRITEDSVTYVDQNGVSHEVKAGNVVMAVGMRPLADEALAFYGKATYTRHIGDCDQASTVQHAMSTAYASASQI